MLKRITSPRWPINKDNRPHRLGKPDTAENLPHVLPPEIIPIKRKEIFTTTE
jgi:hypothetical protein